MPRVWAWSMRSRTKSLRTFDPDARVSVDLASHSVVIDGAADRDDYVYVIRDTGYTPEARGDGEVQGHQQDGTTVVTAMKPAG